MPLTRRKRGGVQDEGYDDIIVEYFSGEDDGVRLTS